MIEIVFFECKHFVVELFALVPPFKVLLHIQHILNIFIENVDGCSLFPHDLINLVCVEVCLGRRIALVELALKLQRVYRLIHRLRGY